VEEGQAAPRRRPQPFLRILTAWRDCLETPNRPHDEVLRVCATDKRAPFGRFALPRNVRCDPHNEFPDSLWKVNSQKFAGTEF
jgi:hypothetical protein